MVLAKNDDVSGKSSPSREVEKILNDVETYETYFDTVTDDIVIKSKIEYNGSPKEDKTDYKTNETGI